LKKSITQTFHKICYNSNIPVFLQHRQVQANWPHLDKGAYQVKKRNERGEEGGWGFSRMKCQTGQIDITTTEEKCLNYLHLLSIRCVHSTFPTQTLAVVVLKAVYYDGW